jgi:hypothetical protein
MKCLLLFSFLTVLTYNSFSQSQRAFEISLSDKNNFKVKIETITEEDFIKSGTPEKIELQISTESDSILNIFRKESSSLFSDSASCLILNGENEIKKLCIDTSSSDTKSWEGFSFIKYTHEFLVFKHYGYEWEEYVLFNPKTKNTKTIEGYPLFTNKFVFAASNYYGEGFFEFFGPEINSYYRFDTFNWQLTGFYHINSLFFFSFSSNSQQAMKFIKLDASNGL